MTLCLVGVGTGFVPAVRPIVHRAPVARMSAVDDDACHLVRKFSTSLEHVLAHTLHAF